MIEPRERIDFSLEQLPKGGTGLRSTIEWLARVPHLDGEFVLSASEATVLGEVSPTIWTTTGELANRANAATVEELLKKGLLVGEGSEADVRDRKLREIHWRPSL